MVFIPKNTLFLAPATLIHAGGLRTGPRGNPRMHFVFFLIEKEKEQQALQAIPNDFTSEYLGLQAGEGHDFTIMDKRPPFHLGTHSHSLYDRLEFLRGFASSLAF